MKVKWPWSKTAKTFYEWACEGSPLTDGLMAEWCREQNFDPRGMTRKELVDYIIEVSREG